MCFSGKSFSGCLTLFAVNLLSNLVNVNLLFLLYREMITSLFSE